MLANDFDRFRCHKRSRISPLPFSCFSFVDKMKRPLYEHKCVDFMLKIVNSDSPVELKHLAAKCLPHILTNGSNLSLPFFISSFP